MDLMELQTVLEALALVFDGTGLGDFNMNFSGRTSGYGGYYPYYGYGPYGWGGPWGGYPYGGYPGYWGGPYGYPYAAPAAPAAPAEK